MAKPPAVRGTSAREVIAFSQAGGQVRVPPTDAFLGYSVMAHRRSEIRLYSLAGDKSILFRLGGTASRDRARTEAEMAQRAKVGYSPRCTDSTYVAVLATYEVGEFSNEKALGLGLSKASGPRAARRYAAYLSL